jgi:hypothetical protein
MLAILGTVLLRGALHFSAIALSCSLDGGACRIFIVIETA